MDVATTLGTTLVIYPKSIRFLTAIGIIGLSLAAPQLRAENHLLIVGGLGGDAEFQKTFDEQAQKIYDAALSLGSANALAKLLIGPDATKENILAALTPLKLQSNDLLQVHLIGHGSFDGSHYKFNIPGPDLSDTELADTLNKLSGQQMVAVMTSSSGAALETLKADNRLVITATKSGLQNNASVFSRFWADGVNRGSADLNKNEIISIAELYRYTNDQVSRYYESERLIASESSRIETPENLNADLFNLSRIGQLAKAGQSAETEALLAQRSQIEGKLSELSSRRQSLTEDQYFSELQNLMLELGALQRQIDAQLGEGNE